MQVTVSPKYQVVIPRAVREAMKLRPGQKLEVFELGGLIRLVPVKSARKLRGFAKGIDTDVPRDRDRV
jgi:AbrB family looped-hinge helix DNA binding protein